ncbi:GNAT family N-acetyltransferase [Thalassotalea fusca]
MILVRHSNTEDILQIKEIYEQPENYAQTLPLPFPSLEKWQKFMSSSSDNFYSLVAERDGQIVGQLGMECFQSPRRRHVANIGMAVDNKHQRQGIGEKLLSSAIDLAFNWLAIRRIELEVYTDNVPAVALYEKLGFEQEGIAKDYAFKDGKYVDVIYMAKTCN